MNDQPNDQSNKQSSKQANKNPTHAADQSGLSAENSAHLRDLLISRVIDGSASPEDWSSFRILAANDAEVWTDLSDAQREHEALCEVMNAASSIADGIDLPGGSGSPVVFESWVSTATRWGGWAIAAVLMLGWYTKFRQHRELDPDQQSKPSASDGSVPACRSTERASDRRDAKPDRR